MFEDWKAAWREAVESFYRELNEGEGPVNARLHAMRREIAAANGELRRLEAEIARARKAVDEERAEEAVCRRRQAAAQRIEDAETARLAGEWAERHARRARVLEQKLEALRAEHEMRAGDLAEMEAALAAASDAAAVEAGQGPAGAGVGGGTPPGPSPEEDEARAAQDREFRRLDREARERAAEARLEELKKRMR
ncbi:MAG: hypothetical protein IRZ00_13100 [Gemmatimonadetes bacterium]|nr:hypothetical protein [Gemmatimonadota bacterium]